MGYDYSYQCISVRNARRLDTFGEEQILLVDAQFEDEHGHAFAPLQDILVVLEGESADLEKYPENFLPDGADKATFQKYERLCENHPGYSAYDTADFGAMVLAALTAQMLEIKASWDWYGDDLTAEEGQAIEEGRLAAVMREDGDNEAALVEAVLDIKAPKEAVRYLTIDPCIADCFLAIAWDSRSVSVVLDEQDD